MRARLLAAAVDFWIKPAARSLLPRRKRAGLQRAVVELLLSLAPTGSGLRGGMMRQACEFSGRPVPSFRLCTGRPTSLSREPVLELLGFLRTKGMILS
jgi:hypothetical protein